MHLEVTMRLYPRTRNATALFTSALILGAVCLTAWPATARADDDRSATPEETRRITEALTAQGYADVHDIEVDDGRFEVDARHPEGYAVDLELDLATLEILHEDRD
jgi:hypothetical protein